MIWVSERSKNISKMLTEGMQKPTFLRFMPFKKDNALNIFMLPIKLLIYLLFIFISIKT